jgi:hypothetical protein
LRDDLADLRPVSSLGGGEEDVQMTMSAVELTTAITPPPSTESKKMGSDSLTAKPIHLGSPQE